MTDEDALRLGRLLLNPDTGSLALYKHDNGTWTLEMVDDATGAAHHPPLARWDSLATVLEGLERLAGQH